MNEVFKDIIETLAIMILKALIFRAIMAGIGGGGGGEGGGLFGFSEGGVVKMAKGGLITQPTVFPFADGIGLAGEAGTEAILPLMRTKTGNLGVEATGMGGDVKVVNEVVIINNAQDVDVSQERRTNSRGQEQIVVQIDNALAGRVGRGEGQLVKAIQRNFGATVSPVSK